MLYISQCDDFQKESRQREISKENKNKDANSDINSSNNRILQIFKSPHMCHIIFTTPFIWFFNEILYYGIVFNANNFAG